jgi:hypothetical protein
MKNKNKKMDYEQAIIDACNAVMVKPYKLNTDNSIAIIRTKIERDNDGVLPKHFRYEIPRHKTIDDRVHIVIGEREAIVGSCAVITVKMSDAIKNYSDDELNRLIKKHNEIVKDEYAIDSDDFGAMLEIIDKAHTDMLMDDPYYFLPDYQTKNGKAYIMSLDWHPHWARKKGSITKINRRK